MLRAGTRARGPAIFATTACVRRAELAMIQARSMSQVEFRHGRPFRFLSQFDLCFEVVGSHTLNFRLR